MQVVIVGGLGLGGLILFQQLKKSKHIDQIVLIDSKNFFEFTPSIIYAIQDPRKLKKITIPVEKIIRNKKAKFIKGIVKSISSNEVHFSMESSLEMSKVSFDVCILAFGAANTWPFRSSSQKFGTLEARIQEIGLVSQQVKENEELVVKGAGFVGVEAVTGLHQTRKGQAVLVDRNSEPMKSLGPRVSKKLKRYLAKKGISLKASHLQEEKEKKTEFECFGNTFNRSIVGRPIKVDKQLKLLGSSNIFGLGDCIEECDGAIEPKFGSVVTNQALFLGKLLSKKPPKGQLLDNRLSYSHQRDYGYLVSLEGWDTMFVLGNNGDIALVSKFVNLLHFLGVFGINLQ